MKKKEPGFLSLFFMSFSLSLAMTLLVVFRARLLSAFIRRLSQRLPDPAKARGIHVDLGPGIPGWNKVTLVGQMSETLPQVIGHPVQAVAYSRFGGFNRHRDYSDFQNPNSESYQCWYGAYLVFDNDQRRKFGFNPDGSPSFDDAIAALEADQRLVYHNAGIRKSFANERLVRPVGEVETETVELGGQTWFRMTGQAETWSTYHRGRLPAGNPKFGLCYGVVPITENHGVDDLHALRYRGEFWATYNEAWGATCCKFFIYPTYKNRYGLDIDKVSNWLQKAGQTALAGIEFSKH